jgi:hypothetical protein
LNDKITE